MTLVTLLPDTSSRMRIASVNSIEYILRSLVVVVWRLPGLLDSRSAILSQECVRVLRVTGRDTSKRTNNHRIVLMTSFESDPYRRSYRRRIERSVIVTTTTWFCDLSP
jgi:hypothetical protein